MVAKASTSLTLLEADSSASNTASNADASAACSALDAESWMESIALDAERDRNAADAWRSLMEEARALDTAVACELAEARALLRTTIVTAWSSTSRR